jgi:RNA polymerase sigma-70 factor (ECF subfamily)
MVTKGYQSRMANAVAQAGVIDLADISARVDEDLDIVARCQAGDETAFRELYLRHRTTLHRVVYRLLGPTADLEDVLQEVFLQVHKSIGSFRGQSRLGTWLHRVAVNVALQHLRRKKTTVVTKPDERVEEHTPEESRGASPYDEAETRDRVRAVYRALDHLSPKKRAVLVMHDMQGMSAQAIAEIVRAPVFTVRTRLFYARKEFYKRVVDDPAFSGDISEGELERR